MITYPVINWPTYALTRGYRPLISMRMYGRHLSFQVSGSEESPGTIYLSPVIISSCVWKGKSIRTDLLYWHTALD